MPLPTEITETYKRLQEMVERTGDYKLLLAAVWQIQKLDGEFNSQEHTSTIRDENRYERERLFGRVEIKNEWLYRIGAYEQPVVEGPFPGVPGLSPALVLTHQKLDETLSTRSKYWFLDFLIRSGRLFGISADITMARGAGETGLRGLENSLFDIALNCPVLAWDAKNELFRIDPDYFQGSWGSCFSEIISGSEYDRIFFVARPIDDELALATRYFFRGLHWKDNRLIGESSEHLRKHAYLLRGDTSRLASESSLFESFGLKSFPEAIRVLLKNESVAVGPLEYQVVVGPPRNEVWLVVLPVHEFWFVEQATPWTLNQYKSDPIGFIRKHFDEIPRSTASRWSLRKADLLEGLALEMGLENYAHGLSDMAFRLVAEGKREAGGAALTAQIQVSQQLADLAQRLPSDLHSRIVYAAVAELLVQVALYHTPSIEGAMKAALVRLVYEFLLAGKPKKE